MSQGFRYFLTFSGVIFIALVLGVLITDQLHPEPHEISTPASAEARKNPFLAAERLLVRLDHEVTHVDSLTAEGIPQKDATLFLTGHHQALAPALARQIRQWVEEGGHLVIVPDTEQTDDDVMVADDFVSELGINIYEPDAWGVEAPRRVVIGQHAMELGYAPPFALSFSPEESSATNTDWQMTLGEHIIALRLDLQNGSVTVLSTALFARNNQLGRLDHAEILVATLASRRDIVVAAGLSIPTLSAIVWRHGWPFILASLLALLLWLRIRSARFGPVAPDPQPIRRSLIEHLTAAGRLSWQSEQSGELVELKRRQVLRRVISRVPDWHRLTEIEQGKRIARISGLPESYRQTLTPYSPFTKRPNEEDRFVEAMTSLHTLERAL